MMKRRNLSHQIEVYRIRATGAGPSLPQVRIGPFFVHEPNSMRGSGIDQEIAAVIRDRDTDRVVRHDNRALVCIQFPAEVMTTRRFDRDMVQRG